MNLRQKVVSGLFWVAVSSVSVLAIGMVSSAILARLLTPRDFGLIEIALIFISFAITLGEFGLGSAVVQWADDVSNVKHTGFWLNVGLSLGLAVLLFALAPSVAAFYSAPELAWLLRALALGVVLHGVGVVPGGLLERELEFRRRTPAEIIPLVCYSLVAIGLALAGCGVWSLVAGQIASRLARTGLLWQRAGFLPKAQFDRIMARRLVSFGRHIVLISLLLFGTSKIDIIYLGRVADPSQVGFYGLAMTITRLVVDLITSLFGRVTFPAFSRLQGEITLVAKTYLRATSFISYTVLPIVFGTFAVAPAAIVGIYGPRWAPAVALTRVLCLFALFRALSRLTGSVFTSTGRPDVTTRIAFFRLVSFGLLLVTLGPICYTNGVAWAASLSMMISGLWSIWLTNRHLGIEHRHLVHIIGPKLAASVLMCAGVSLVSVLLPESVLAFAVLTALGVVLYAALLLAFGRRAVHRDVKDVLILLREQRQAAG